MQLKLPVILQKLIPIISIKRPSLRSSIKSEQTYPSRLGPLWTFLSRLIPALVVFITVAILFQYDLLGRLQDSTADQFLYEPGEDNDIIILGIDNRSLQEYGRWPWDRDVFAKIQKKLNSFDVKLIGWDITFFEESDKDAPFAKAINNSDKPVILASAISPTWQTGYLAPIQDFQKKNVEMGFINIRADADGRLRSTPLYEQDRNGICHKSYGLVMYETYTGITSENPCIDGLAEVPLNEDNNLIINYVGAPGSIQEISISDFLAYDVIPESLEGKAVVIGVTARNLQDYKLTPTSSSFMSGAEIMGNIFHTLKDKEYLTEQLPEYKLLALFLISLFAVIIMRFQKVLIGSVIVFGIMNIYLLFTLWNFSNGVIMDLVYFPIAGFGAWLTQLSLNYYTNKQEEVYIRGAFEHYVSKKILTEIIRDREKLALGGQSKDLTVLFSDIRGFTKFSENVAPRKLVDLTNDYLTEMSNIITDQDGFIDKYIGDEIMAFWGAPLEDKHHAFRAANTAIEMIRRLGTWKNERKFNEGEFNIGIGVNTGKMVVGNIGSDERFSYTVMGDSVNLGSRLEGLTKVYKVPIIISESTYRQLQKAKQVYVPKNKKNKNTLILRELDIVKVKGRDNPVRLYELIGRSAEVEDQFERIEVFYNALQLYRKGIWNKAEKEFKKIQSYDAVAQTFITRISVLREDKSLQWNGVWEMQTKE